MVAAINNNRCENLAIPQDEAYFEYGADLFLAGNFGPAWTAFNEAIKINPRECMYFYMRGGCSLNMGHYRAALADYNMAMGLAKNNEEKGWVHFDLAVLYTQMGDEQNALSHLTTAARLGNGMARNTCLEAGIPY
jgi:tetratricopeptide (TPR) repeat protein